MNDNHGVNLINDTTVNKNTVGDCFSPKGRPVDPNNSIEYNCYYVWFAAFHCKRAWQTQTWETKSPIRGKGDFVGDPFTQPKFSHLVTDETYINNIESLDATGKWLRCTDCITYDRHWIPLIYIVKENHVKSTLSKNAEGGVDISCPSTSAPPPQFTYQDLVDQNISQYCPNYYKLSLCTDCAGFTSTPVSDTDLSTAFRYISLPHNETLDPLYPILRIKPHNYITDTLNNSSVGYGCYTWAGGGTQAIDGKYYPAAASFISVYDKKSKQAITSPDSFRYFDTCENCQNDVVLMFEKCAGTCDGNDVLNSYSGTTLMDANAATRAGNCISSGDIVFRRMVMNTANLAFAKLINGKTYIANIAGQNICVKITHIPCPNILVRNWYNYYWDGSSLKSVTSPSQIYVTTNSFPQLYDNCTDCNNKVNPIAPPPANPPRVPPAVPPAGFPGGPPAPKPACAACGPSDNPETEVVVYTVLVKGDKYKVYLLKSSAPSSTAKFITSGNILQGNSGRWTEVKIPSTRNADGTWNFDVAGYKAGQFMLDEDGNLISYETTLAGLGTSPTAWELPSSFVTYRTCRALADNSALVEYSDCGI